MSYAGRNLEKPNKNSKQSVLIVSAQNPYWTEKFAAGSLFSRATVKSQSAEALRKMVAEEAGLSTPFLQEQISALETDEDSHPYQSCVADQLPECVFDLLSSDFRINH